MRKLGSCLLLLTSLMAGGCADTAIFATSTSLGINLDTKPSTVAVAFDRTEVFIGPRSQNGGAPAAVASIETAGPVLAPYVRQTYATGPAAVLATNTATLKGGEDDELMGPRKPMMFGTGTTVGFKVGFSPEGVPDSAIFGYRRKEASVIPLGVEKDPTTGKETARYPSVLASIDTTSKMDGLPASTGFSNKQYFATGQAAKNLAVNPQIRRAFKAQAVEALTRTKFAEDDSSRRIRAYIYPKGIGADGVPIETDATRVEQVRAWYVAQPGGKLPDGQEVEFIQFLDGDIYAPLRKAAVVHFNLPAVGGG